MTDDRAPRDGGGSTVGIGTVQGDAHNVATHTQGPVWMVENYWASARRRRTGPLELDADHEQQLRHVFVAPRGWERARMMLAERRIVLLTGRVDSGRRTAAWRLLVDADRGADGRAVEELSPGSGDPDDQALDPDEIHDGGRYLLDLSTTDELTGGPLFARLRREIPGLLNTIRRRCASLVMILPADTDQLLPEHRDYEIVLGLPEADAVLRNHLSWHGLTLPADLPTELSTDLAANGPGQAALFAHLFRRVRKTEPGAGVEQWLAAARDATFGRQREVAELVRTHTGARPRALMLAAALFDGAPDEIVTEAERWLLSTVEHIAESDTEFERHDLGTRLGEIGGQILPDGRVTFRTWNQAAAVRTHFWTQFPGLRGSFRDWAIRCGPLMAGAGGAEPVERFVEECLRVRRHDDVRCAVEKWAGLPQPAGVALVHALRQPAHGWFFRRACYRWATNPGSVSVPLAGLVVTVCRQVIARTHPRQAIVRLRHLAVHPDEQVCRAARTGLADVVGGDVELLRYFLGRPSGTGGAQRRTADAWCFVTVVGRWLGNHPAAALFSGPGVRTGVVERWRDVFDALEAGQRSTAIRAWLDGATREPEAGAGLTAVLIEATECRTDRVRALEEAARDWAFAAADREAHTLRSQLVGELDAAVVETTLHDALAGDRRARDTYGSEGERDGLVE